MTESGRIHIGGKLAGAHTVTADVLIRSVRAVQNCALILGAMSDQGNLCDRFCPSAKIRNQYSLRISASEPGSYIIPFAISDENQEQSLRLSQPLSELYDVVSAISENDRDAFNESIKDEAVRMRVLMEFATALPAHHETWTFGFELDRRSLIELDANDRDTAISWCTAPILEDERLVVAELIRINFPARKFSVRDIITRNSISLTFDPSQEECILSSRVGRLAIVGKFELDAKMNPKSAIGKVHVERLTDEPVEIHELRSGNSSIRFILPVELHIKIESDGLPLLYAEVEEFGFFVSGRTISEIKSDFAEQILFAWDEYVKADQSLLSEGAIKLRRALQTRVEIV